MKRIFSILSAACALVSVSCINDIEDVFEASASERLNEKLHECKELLTSPEHGWLIHYYPSPDRSWGGCTYAAKFDADGNVSVTSDVAPRKEMSFDAVVKSHYSI